MRLTHLDYGGHHRLVVQGEALPVGHQLTHPAQTVIRAAFDLPGGAAAQHRIDDGETDEALRVAAHGLDHVIVGHAAQASISPAEAEGNRLVHAGAIHFCDQVLGSGQPGLWIAVQFCEPGITAEELLAMGDDLWRCDVGVKVYDQQ